MLQKWVIERAKERTSLDGIVLIGAGVAYLILGQAIASLIAYGAIAYGAYTLWKSE